MLKILNLKFTHITFVSEKIMHTAIFAPKVLKCFLFIIFF